MEPAQQPQWRSVAAEPEFRALVRSRRRFVLPATIFFIVYYFALPISVGLWPGVMSKAVLGPLTLAYCFAFSQFVMTWTLLGLYLYRARRFDAEAARLRQREMQELSNSR